MSQDRDDSWLAEEADSVVSAEYRAAATERTPPQLDAIVLNTASAAAKNSGLRRFTASWLRPLAFMATLALSLALVLELTRSPDLQPITDPESEFGRQEMGLPDIGDADALNDTGSEFRLRTDSPGKIEQPAAPARTEAVDPNVEDGGRAKFENKADPENAAGVDEQPSPGFADVIDATSTRMQESGGVVENAIQGLRQTRPAGNARAGETASSRASAVASDVAARPCTEEQMSEPLSWWLCITELQESGLHDAAEAELGRFNTAHPDFEPPESLPSQ